ncbi:MAG: signal peptidase I [Phototrophicaceae bacterium]
MKELIMSIQWRELIRELLIMALIIGVLQFVLPRSVVQGSSMQPNLATGQRLAASPLPYIWGQPQRGDIVMMYPVEEDGSNLVKRIIGLPNETILIHDGVLVINGTAIQEPYLNTLLASRRNGFWELDDNEYFIVGDNRNTSYDSRNYGAVSGDLIMGKVLFRWYPLNQLRWFSD